MMKSRSVLVGLAVWLLGAAGAGAIAAHAEMVKALPAHTVSVSKRQRQLFAHAHKHTHTELRRQGWTVAHGKRLAIKARNRKRNKRGGR